MLFSPDRTLTRANNATSESGEVSDGQNVWSAWVNSTGGVVSVVKSTDQGYTWGTAVTVDTNAANSAVMLNEPFVRDAISGPLYLFWDRNEDSGTTKASLVMSKSSDSGATWSAAKVVDDGTAYPVNQFYRVGAAAYNGVVAVVYTPEDGSTFVTNGHLMIAQSTDGGVTWSAPAALVSGVTGPHEPNVHVGEDGSLHVSWYDPGANTNAGGDIYYLRGTWTAGGWTFPASATRVTTGQTCGRCRVTASAGVVLIATNTNWGGDVADVAIVRSTDNGTTWGNVVTVATHTPGASLTHPWAVSDGLLVRMVWLNVQTTNYESALSTDAGATWSSGPKPIAATSSSDAPKLVLTTDTVLVVADAGKLSTYPLFSPDPASTATTVLDTFDRANENPLSGGGVWSADTAIGAAGACKIVSNVATRQSGAGVFDRAGSYRNDQTVGTSYEVFLTTGGSTDGEIDVMLADEGTKNGYFVKVNGGTFGGPGTFLTKFTGGASTTLFSDTTRGLTIGDKILLRTTPTEVIAYRWTGTDWQESSRNPDTTYRAGSMHPAINIAGQAGVPTANDFGVTTLATVSNTVAPSASGAIGVGNTLTVTNGTWATANGATPTKYRYQWQTSAAGANSWSNVSRATLPFFTVTDATKDHRCVVTASNSIGSATANSNAVSVNAGGGFHHDRYGRCRRFIGAQR